MRYFAKLILAVLILASGTVADERGSLVENRDLESPQLLSAALESDRSITISWKSLPYEASYLVWRQVEVNYVRASDGRVTRSAEGFVGLVPWSIESLWIEIEVTHRREGSGATVRLAEPLVDRIEWSADDPLPAGARVFATVMRYDDETNSTWGVSSVRRALEATQYSPPAVISVGAVTTSVQTESWGRLKRRMAE